MQAGDRTSAIAEFADAHGLAYAERVELPPQGALLEQGDLTQSGTATGTLPGGETGTLCHLTYSTRSDDTSRTHHRTAVIVRLPESIGFAPYLATSPTGSLSTPTSGVKLDGGGRLFADDGIDDGWLAELLSPAFTHWIQRSPEGFAWELAGGVLCASRDGHVGGEAELVTLCEDTALIARTVREECLEEVDSGKAAASAAKREPVRQDRLADAILARTTFENPPTDVASALPQFRALAVRHPSTYLISLFRTLAWMLGINIIGGGIFGLLLNLPNPGLAVLVFELGLFLVVGFLCLRSQINGLSSKLAAEGFWREYARGRQLTVEDASGFAAAHAKAALPGAPVRVLTGVFGGVPGSLLLTGDGLKRGDSIALVAGPTGPIATAELDLSAPGASAAALDAYVETLVLDLQTQP